MDFDRPVEAVIPGAQGRILAVLAETTGELNLRTIARLSGVSLAQASRVLPWLVELGMIERRDVPPSALFRLVENHVAARLVLELSRAPETVLRELGDLARTLLPEAVSVIVFGSVARGEADVDSDVDVIAVRPDDLDEDDDEWVDAIEHWRQAARALTGNPLEVIDVGENETRRLLASRRPLWRAVAKEGIVITGRSFADLRAPAVA
jgi:predicted nucleotidyltransferase